MTARSSDEPNLLESSRRLLTIVSTRAQLVKAALVDAELARTGELAPGSVETVFLGSSAELELAGDALRMIGVRLPGSLTHRRAPAELDGSVQLAHELLSARRPAAVLLYGDSGMTVAAALAAVELAVPAIHLEAGERLYRREGFPEEANRVLTDHAAALCLTCTRRASWNLGREGMGPERVEFVGDPLYDAFCALRTRAEDERSGTLERFEVKREGFHLATLRRARLEGPHAELRDLLRWLDQAPIPVLLPLPGQVRDRLLSAWKPARALRIVDPLRYDELLGLLLGARTVVTDSGVVAREAFFAHRPCLVPLETTWWPEIEEAGWAVPIGAEFQRLPELLSEFVPPNEYPSGLFGDGNSAAAAAGAVAGFVGSERATEGAWHPHGRFSKLPTARASVLTTDNYRALLAKITAAGYEFRAFHEVEEASSQEQALPEDVRPYILLRHDLDLDLERALVIAEIEAQLNARSTYFLLVRTEHYNVFSRAGSESVRRILELGHQIGLHFDAAAYPDVRTAAGLGVACNREAGMLEDWFGVPVRAVSFHRPNDLVLSGESVSAPRPHTYLPRFTQQIAYLSDSRGAWATVHPLESDAFRDRKPFQLLTHPVWWTGLPLSPHQSLQQLVSEKQHRLELSIAANCRSYRVGSLWRFEE